MTLKGCCGEVRRSDAAGERERPRFRAGGEGDSLRARVRPSLAPRRRWAQFGVFGLFRLAALINGLALVIILVFLLVNGWRAISWEFLTEVPRDSMTKGGIFTAWWGTFLLSFGAMVIPSPGCGLAITS